MDPTGSDEFRPDAAGSAYHEPAMLSEVLEYLDPQPGDTVVDGTVGGGGHALAICERIGPTGRLIAIDQDEEAIAEARRRLQGCPVTFVRDSFRHIDNIIAELGIGGVDGWLFDLGVSSHQLDAAERGFSFRYEAPLDMRMDRRMAATAADVLDRLSEKELVRIFAYAGLERWARRLARTIITARQQHPITTTTALADLITRTIPASHRSTIHPATKAFLALRIAVNDELAALSDALTAAVHHSNTGARLVILAYHSTEDRIVKRTFRYLAGKPLPPLELQEPAPPALDVPLVRVLTKRPVTPSDEEVRHNRRARSALLRAAERL